MKNKHIAQLENMAISPLLASIGCNGAASLAVAVMRLHRALRAAGQGDSA